MNTCKNNQLKEKLSSKSTKDSKKVQIGGRSPAFENTKDKKKIRIGGRSPAFR